MTQDNRVQAPENHAPRKMTVAETATYTVKILVGFGLIGLVLWAIDLWKST